MRFLFRHSVIGEITIYSCVPAWLTHQKLIVKARVPSHIVRAFTMISMLSEQNNVQLMLECLHVDRSGCEISSPEMQQN